MAAEFALSPKNPGAPRFAGCGVQFNNNVFAQQTIDQGVSPASHPNLRNKILKLEPQFVRIFYNDKHAGFPHDKTLPKSLVNAPQTSGQADRWRSFVKTVRLAEDANALINVTWQSGPHATVDERNTSMERFANVLEHLVKKERITQLQWATIANEPNTKPEMPGPGDMTPESLGQMYRKLDRLLKDKGLRKQVGLMGGDVIEGPKNPALNRVHQTSPFNQLAWLKFMAAHLSDVIDAYAVHIYWNYFELPRMKLRLDGVRKVARFVNKDLPPAKRKRVYVTEFGVRGRDRDNDKGIDPGFFHEGGYAGVIKWDAFYGRYDLVPLHPEPGKPPAPPKGNQQYFAIDKPRTAQDKEWRLLPMYFLLRLFTVATERDWMVRPITVTTGNSQPSKHLVGFQGSGNELTIIGLHINGASKNVRTNPDIRYTIGGLPKSTTFQLLLWNARGGGRLTRHDTPITSNAGGEAQVVAPMRSVFALTTKKLPETLF
jgi:hypothetical protein